jgi:hypothetical protein
MKNQYRIAHHSATVMLAIALGTLACIGLKATAMDDGVPYGRRLPAAVHHVAAGGVLVVACEHVTTTSASLVNTTWLNQESEVISLDNLIDGSLVNAGPGNLLCLRLDDGVLVWIAPGESLLAGPSVVGYQQGCLCTCGNGTVFIEPANCGGTCSNCNGKGPCLDPTNSQKVPGFSACTTGWGPSGN